ncbi:MAG TPA: hypothetical protein VGG39_36460 [Polyangiaceae bacterium]|jgi:hypothetical protein
MRRVLIPSGKGDILYGETPFGWKLNDDRSKLVPDPEEQRLLSVVRHMYLSERLPMRGIVERLGKMGIVNRRGSAFGLSGVWEMIHRRSDKPPEAKPKKSRAAKRRAPSKKRKG